MHCRPYHYHLEITYPPLWLAKLSLNYFLGTCTFCIYVADKLREVLKSFKRNFLAQNLSFEDFFGPRLPLYISYASAINYICWIRAGKQMKHKITFFVQNLLLRIQHFITIENNITTFYVSKSSLKCMLTISICFCCNRIILICHKCGICYNIITLHLKFYHFEAF